MATKTEQLDACHNVVEDYDQPLKPSEIYNCLRDLLGENIQKQSYQGKTLYIYTSKKGKKIVLLCKNLTYLGNPHPILKKRIQLPEWYKEFCLNNPQTDIRYIGVYHYNGLVIFVDFEKTTYLLGKSHNSSAHAYTNDLYQALVHKTFRKKDKNGNIITAISSRYFQSYLEGSLQSNEIFTVLDDFHQKFQWKSWITAEYAITEMHNNQWSQWRQTEWAGWFLEYLFSSFLKNNKYDNIIVYTAFSHKGQGALDFDLYFPSQNFQGDLKASDISHTETPGNDQEKLLESLNQYGRFWFLIYEHETQKDKDIKGNPATTFRNNFLYEIDGIKKKNTSYLSKMKYAVNFKKMTILEINRVNCRQLLTAFNQGKQPDGSPRKPKFNINKKSKDIDNFIVYQFLP